MSKEARRRRRPPPVNPANASRAWARSISGCFAVTDGEVNIATPIPLKVCEGDDFFVFGHGWLEDDLYQGENVVRAEADAGCLRLGNEYPEALGDISYQTLHPLATD